LAFLGYTALLAFTSPKFLAQALTIHLSRSRLLFPPAGFTFGAVHKIAFILGPVTVSWYGVFVAAGFLFGLWNASRRALRAGIEPEAIFDCGTWLLLGAVAGARIFYVVSYWPDIVASARDYNHSPFLEILMVQHGGLVYYGGLMGSSAACIAFSRWQKLPLWKLADILAPGVALGSFFGRWGCLMNGCCYGRPTTMPWGIQFPPDHPTYPHFVHPTEIYDSMLNLGLFAGLAWFYRRRKFDGQVFALYLICYALLRSLVEYFRGDYPPREMTGWATPAQLVSIGTLAAGVLLWVFLPRGKILTPAQTERKPAVY
jgi:phosphatidylglycerol:prolipoprotein diacylglycerol transferase